MKKKKKKVPTKDKNYWYCCDFETLTMNTEEFKKTGDFKVILSNSRNWVSNENFTFTNIKSWGLYHLSLNHSQVLFFHNLSGDGEFILRFLANELNYVDLTKDNGDKQNNTFSVFRRGSKIYKISIRIRSKNKIFTICIKCSYLLLSSSIKSLGQSLGIAKYEEGQDEVEFYDVEPKFKVEDYDKDFVDYCLRDCEIMHKALLIFEENVNNFKVIKSFNEGRKKANQSLFEPLEYLTISSLSRELQKRYVVGFAKYNGEGRYLKSSFEESKFLRNGFAGGLTQTNPKFIDKPKQINNAMFIDVTSAYPYQMTFYLPYGDIYNKKPKNCNVVELLEIEVGSAKIKGENRNCVFLKNGKKQKNRINTRYVKSQKHFKCFYFREEGESLQNYYTFKGVKIKSYWMKTKPFLRTLNLELFAMKEKYENSPALKLCSKTLLNSGYGSLCKKEKYDNYMYFAKNCFGKALEKQETIILNEQNYLVKNNHQHFNFSPEKLELYVLEKMQNPEFSVNIAAASYITSKQRAYLMNTINDVGKKNFIMCDTDSVLFNSLSLEQKNYIKNNLLGSGLGEGKDECESDVLKGFGSYGAKRYILKSRNKLIKFRFAGVSMNVSKLKEKVESLDFGEGHITIENAIYEKVYTKSGVGLMKKDKVIRKGMY